MESAIPRTSVFLQIAVVLDIDNFIKNIYTIKCWQQHRGVAQLGRALRSGRRGRRFKSCHLDFFVFFYAKVHLCDIIIVV